MPYKDPAMQREAERRYREKHHDRRRESARRYYRANKQRLLAKGRKYSKENPHIAAKAQRKYRDTNRGLIALKAKNKRHKSGERVREIGRIASHNRRAREAGASGQFSADDVQKKLDGQKQRCWWCTKKLRGKYDVDHVIPLIRGGSNGPENIVIACQSCNRSKNKKLPQEFAGRLL